LPFSSASGVKVKNGISATLIYCPTVIGPEALAPSAKDRVPLSGRVTIRTACRLFGTVSFGSVKLKSVTLKT